MKFGSFNKRSLYGIMLNQLNVRDIYVEMRNNLFMFRNIMIYLYENM